MIDGVLDSGCVIAAARTYANRLGNEGDRHPTALIPRMRKVRHRVHLVLLTLVRIRAILKAILTRIDQGTGAQLGGRLIIKVKHQDIIEYIINACLPWRGVQGKSGQIAGGPVHLVSAHDAALPAQLIDSPVFQLRVTLAAEINSRSIQPIGHAVGRQHVLLAIQANIGFVTIKVVGKNGERIAFGVELVPGAVWTRT